MEEGTKVDVFYKDGDSVRKKSMKYIGCTNGICTFLNLMNNKIEYIPIYNIVRMEERQGEGKEEHLGEYGDS